MQLVFLVDLCQVILPIEVLYFIRIHYWINVSAHIKSTIDKVLFCLESFLSQTPYDGDNIGYWAEARFQVTTQAKIKDHLFMHWTREASSYDRLAGTRLICKAPVGKMLQSCSSMFHVSCNVA